jgi:hypothetical protein
MRVAPGKPRRRVFIFANHARGAESRSKLYAASNKSVAPDFGWRLAAVYGVNPHD